MEEGLQTFEASLQDIHVEENAGQALNQRALSVTVIEEEACEHNSDKEPTTNKREKDLSTKAANSLFPSIDIEVNVTISIDSGSILLHSGSTG